MKGKKFVNFLLCKPAFTQRNLSTLLLVALFVGVYSLAGGKVTLQVPNIDTSESTFGGVSGVEHPKGLTSESDAAKAARVLGMKPTADESARLAEENGRGKSFDPSMDGDSGDGKLDKDGLIGLDPREKEDAEAKLRKFEKHKGDSLAIIEERLKINRIGKVPP